MRLDQFLFFYFENKNGTIISYYTIWLIRKKIYYFKYFFVCSNFSLIFGAGLCEGRSAGNWKRLSPFQLEIVLERRTSLGC